MNLDTFNWTSRVAERIIEEYKCPSCGTTEAECLNCGDRINAPTQERIESALRALVATVEQETRERDARIAESVPGVIPGDGRWESALKHAGDKIAAAIRQQGQEDR